MPPAKRTTKTAGPDAAQEPPAKSAPATLPTAAVSLDGVLGQPTAVATLRSAIASGRVHHAWIFHGPHGVGKFTTACAFGATLLGVEPHKVRFHPDFHVVTKELAAVSSDSDTRKRKLTNIPFKVLEEFFIEPITLAPTQAGPGPIRKVFIIDQADMMDARGQNSLLKSLEEPPPGTVIVLVTGDESSLITTVRSRCQRAPFIPLDDRSMRTWLEATPLQHDPYQRDWLLWAAAGSPGAFAMAVQTGLFSWHETLEPLLAQADRGSPPSELGGVITALVDARAVATVKESANASKEVANRVWGRRMFEYLARRFGGKVRDPKATPHAKATALHAIELLDAGESQLDANLRFADVAENFVVQLGVAGVTAR